MTPRLTEGRACHRVCAALLVLLSLAAAAVEPEVFSTSELERIAAHGPWPQPWEPDPGNRVSGKAAAIRLGHDLFFDPQLSADRRVACASCHDPARGFQDGRAVARGLKTGTRNTPGLFNLRHQRWFGWDGGHDSLWSASLRPILDPHEMGGNAARTTRALRSKAVLKCHYAAAFGKRPDANDPDLPVNVAKALAAWHETPVSRPAPFDLFRAAPQRGDAQAAAAYPAAAKRGLRRFLGRGQCATCHAGPLFTNGERCVTTSPPRSRSTFPGSTTERIAACRGRHASDRIAESIFPHPGALSPTSFVLDPGNLHTPVAPGKLESRVLRHRLPNQSPGSGPRQG